ncbi:DUF2029 domain-containing protein [Streptomyces sp. NBC_00322]|uniref:glycosyltransferase family 87 protein n=1 Tax=Streptomyces sp. NBC_00322 TaxID=2975712 RepID=UPI002E2BB524|nr:glycosyltransferase family 87 protein [Streptomyces sp. NBC_00322]
MPLLWLIAIGRAQMEVGVVERGAQLLLSSGSPYQPNPHAVPDFNPYLPGMSLFGIPHALFGDSVFTSARVWSLLGFLAAVIAAVRVSAKSGAGVPANCARVTGVLWLIACPVVALPLAIGGVDPPVVALICLTLAYSQRGHAGRAGLVLGVAAALKGTAWPALPVVIAVLAVRHGRRAALRCAAAASGIAVLAVLPALLRDSGAFYENAILYPFGLSDTKSSAESPLLGHLIVSVVPNGEAVTMALILLSAVGLGMSLLVRPPRNTVAAANRLALGLGLIIMLSPATRVGYAIYPLILLTWPRFAVGLSRGTRPCLRDHPERTTVSG